MRAKIVGVGAFLLLFYLAVITGLGLFWLLAALSVLALAVPTRRPSFLRPAQRRSTRPRYLPDAYYAGSNSRYYARGQSWPRR